MHRWHQLESIHREVNAVSSHRLGSVLAPFDSNSSNLESFSPTPHRSHPGKKVGRLLPVINSVRGTQPLVLMLLLSLYSQRVHQTAKKISPKLPHTALGLWLHQQQDCNLTTTTAIGHCPRNLKSYIMALLKIPYSKAKSLSEVSNACSVSGM